MATLDEVITSLVDNADWEATQDVAKARAFVTAANRYLILMPSSSSEPGGFQVSMNVGEVRTLLERASLFVASMATNQNSTGVVHLRIRPGFRD